MPDHCVPPWVACRCRRRTGRRPTGSARFLAGRPQPIRSRATWMWRPRGLYAVAAQVSPGHRPGVLADDRHRAAARDHLGADRPCRAADVRRLCGRRVATTNLAGRTLADVVLGADTDLTRLPWVGHRSPAWEAEPPRWLGTNAGLCRRGDRGRELLGFEYRAAQRRHRRRGAATLGNAGQRSRYQLHVTPNERGPDPAGSADRDSRAGHPPGQAPGPLYPVAVPGEWASSAELIPSAVSRPRLTGRQSPVRPGHRAGRRRAGRPCSWHRTRGYCYHHWVPSAASSTGRAADS
jgi:hypothetical protein